MELTEIPLLSLGSDYTAHLSEHGPANMVAFHPLLHSFMDYFDIAAPLLCARIVDVIDQVLARANRGLGRGRSNIMGISNLHVTPLDHLDENGSSGASLDAAGWRSC